MRKHLSNSNLLREIDRSKERLKEMCGDNSPTDEQRMRAITPELGQMLEILVSNIASSASWGRYSWKEDMKTEALTHLYLVALKFDPSKVTTNPNPFAYYTQIVKRDFIAYVRTENKNGLLKDALYAYNGPLIYDGSIADIETNLSMKFKMSNMTHDSHGNLLDGTNREGVKMKPPHLRRKLNNWKSETAGMTNGEYQRWLDEKKKEYYDKRKSET